MKTMLSLALLVTLPAMAVPPCGSETSAVVEEAMKSTVRVRTCVKVDPNSLAESQELSKEQREEIIKNTPKDADGNLINCGSIGSGVALDAHHVITNAHVVNGGKDIAELHVFMNDGRRFKGQLVGYDTELDLAAIRFDQKFNLMNENVKAAEFAPSDELKIGDTVFAIGQPFGLEKTVAFLSMSRKNRVVSGTKNRYLQLDGAINPGNSGGPTFDCGGKLVGINAAIISKTGQSAGIGLTIPSETVMALAPHLVKEEGEFQGTSLGIMVGVQGANENSPQRVAVAQVKEGGLAAKMGVKPGDLFVAIKNVPVGGEPGMAMALFFEIKSGDEVQLVMERDGQQVSLSSGATVPGPL